MDLTSLRFSWFYAKSQIRTRYRYTFLGFFWNFLEPALYLIILSLVFSVINKMNIRDYAVFLFAALVPWRYFEKVVLSTMESIVGAEWLLKKMYVSPFAFPLNRWIVSSFDLIFSMTAAFTLFAFLKDDWSVSLLIIPLSIIPWAVTGIGIGMICAVLFIFFRDVKPLIQMFLTLVFFTSPILFNKDVFAADSIQGKIMQWHPFTYFAELFQKPIYLGLFPSLNDWVITISISILSLSTGYLLIKKYNNKFYYYL
ncbi:MAG TPA: ABC transporter permease [Ignavibacteriaceae bacterium]|nr:ABC transporter permease [Ignavibacteriaceae bacterium]